MFMQIHQKMGQIIFDNIQCSGGKISFFEYMNTVLYDPNCGYYTGNYQQLGKSGDFITAPEISPLFGECLSKAIHPILQSLVDPVVIEFGAGTGKLAKTLLENLSENISKYIIIEISPALIKLQQELLKEYSDKIIWHDINTPLKNLTGVIIANEVIDAFPVRKFHYADKKLFEYFVVPSKYKNHSFNWHLEAIDFTLEHDISFIHQLNLPDGYTSEYHPTLKPWINNLSTLLQKGAVFIFDYGFPQHEYYHPDRNMGTIMCHYQQQSNTDPFFMPGSQDITAHVNFTQVAEASVEAGFHVAGYTSQAAFLLDVGITELCQSYQDSQAVKLLTLPSEMGELIKVIALSKQLDIPIPGFELQDRRGSL
jgi:SAM-dependent MidA family methyltransferase